MRVIKKLITVLLIILCLGTLIYSGSKIFDVLKGDYQESSMYDWIDSLINTNNKEKEQDWFEFYANQELVIIDKFDYSLQKMDKSSWDALYEQNHDFIGYIWFDSDIIKEPIMQTKEAEYYLRRDFNKKYSEHGTVFMNYENELEDMNLTIYGHSNSYDHTKQFSALNDLHKKEATYLKNSHFTIYFENEYRRYVICYIFSNNEFDTYNHQYTSWNEDDFEKYMNFVKKKNTVPSIDTIEFGDNFVTLQTCMRTDTSYKVMAICKEIGRYSYE